MKLDHIYKSKLKDITNLKERNKAFHKLSDEDKRKEIAFDSLFLLATDVIEPNSGSWYWGGPYLRRFRLADDISAEDLQNCLLDIENAKSTCEVCARGALMLSQIRLGNTLSVAEHGCAGVSEGTPESIVGFTRTIFGQMEEIYEGYDSQERRSLYDVRSRSNLANILLQVILTGNYDWEDQSDYLVKYPELIPDYEAEYRDDWEDDDDY